MNLYRYPPAGLVGLACLLVVLYSLTYLSDIVSLASIRGPSSNLLDPGKHGTGATSSSPSRTDVDAPQPWLEGHGAASVEFLAAMETLHRRQHPEQPGRCDQTIHIPAGRGGGLGSMVQVVARKVVAAIALEGPDAVMILEGPLKHYTRNARCRELSGTEGWGCFFAEPTNCTSTTRSSVDMTKQSQGAVSLWWGDQRFKKVNLVGVLNAAALPASFSSAGPGFWWGVVQAYLIRLNERMQDRLVAVKREIDYGTGRRAPRIAMHLRYGDKQRDEGSQQSGVLSEPSDYFRQAEFIAEQILSSEECSDRAPCLPVGVFIATDSAEALAQAMKWNESTPSIRLVTALATASQNVAANGTHVAFAPMEEDDPRWYQLAEETVIVINLLLGPDHFVGLCMSQIARLVVSIGFARGTLKEAIAMDYINVDLEDRWKLSSQYMPWRRPHG